MMDKLKVYKNLTIGLAVLNLLTLSFLIFPIFGRPFHPKDNHALDAFFRHELNLNETQQKNFEFQKHAHRALVDSLLTEMQSARTRYYVMNASPDSASLARIGNLQSQIELVTFYHFKDIRSILNADQQTKFDAIIQEAVRKLNEPSRKPKD